MTDNTTEARVQAAGAGVFAPLNQYFDIVAFDPRGVGQSTPAIDCELAPASGSPSLPTPLDVDVDALVADAQDYVDADPATTSIR